MKNPFPVLATLAPVVAAVALWGFTRSPFALVFALLGPVIAVASLGDSRRRAKADARREHNRFERDLVAAIHAVDEGHARERLALDRRYPRVASVLSSPTRNSERWRSKLGDELFVRLGTGQVESTLRFQGEPELSEADDTAVALSALLERARVLTEAPIVVDATHGIGVCGSGTQALALANAIVVQLAHALAPTEFSATRTTGLRFDWVLDLPHEDASAGTAARVVTRGAPRNSRDAAVGDGDRVKFHERAGSRSVLVAIAGEEHSLPPDCRIVITVVGSSARISRHPDGANSDEFAPEFASDRQARAFADTLSAAAVELPRPLGHTLVKEVAMNTLQQPQPSHGGSLAACVGVGVDGGVLLDLVVDGPHAIVGGTTGSGKSELLLTWILAMASVHDPTQLNFLLVDFKGGAPFSAVAGLPHSVGMLTDLDESGARRAILSLRAELGRREKILAEADARSVEELGIGVELARLVIVVDEFATLTAQLPELHELFADLASRGRSLGIHLILCTQRPAASVRDAVLANCSLRVSLRVTNVEDSVAVIGVPDAATLPRNIAGRALVARGNGEPELVQLARTSAEQAAQIARRASVGTENSRAPFRPWLDALPSALLPADVPVVPAPGIAFGLLDLPENQRQDPAIFDPVAHGNVMVLGGHQSGKSTALAALAAGATESLVIPASVEGAWDAVSALVDALGESRHPTLVLVDDVDELLGRVPADYVPILVEKLSRLAREGPRAGVSLVLSASTIRGRLQSLSELCESTLYLRMQSKQDFVLAGGSPNDYLADLGPGGGIWNGHRVQVTSVAAIKVSLDEVGHAQELRVTPGIPLVIVSSRPAAIRARLERLGTVTTLNALGTDVNQLSVASTAEILLGDPDSWQGAWSLLTAVKTRWPIAFHDCPVADFRALTRSRHLPLPVSSPDTLVLLEPAGLMSRAVLPQLAFPA
jgi:DNA segregation ATPase FtsK/SpoIIIE, S-DNA-T family